MFSILIEKHYKVVDEYKYLDIIVNSVKNLKDNIFKEMLAYIADKAIKASFAITQKCVSVGHRTPKVALQLFDSRAFPVVNYASETWCRIKETTCIESVQLRFLKFALGVKH